MKNEFQIIFFAFKPVRWLVGGDWYHYVVPTVFGLEDYWVHGKIATNRYKIIGEEHYPKRDPFFSSWL